MKPEFAEGEYLRRLRRLYGAGVIDMATLEARTAHVVAGGHLDGRGEPIDGPPAGSALAATERQGAQPVVDRSHGWRP